MTNENVQQTLQDLIAPLIDELMAAEANGERVDIDEMARRHPLYQEEILSTLRLIRSLDHLDDPHAERDKSSPRLKQIGDFQLLRELGRGGMGIVYEAQQQTVERRVAVKILPFAALADEAHLRRFKNEVRAVGTLQHTNIIPIYSVGVERGVHYYAMQFIDGPALSEVLKALQRNASDTAATEVSKTASQLRVPHDDETFREIEAAISTKRSQFPREYIRTVVDWVAQAAEALAHAHENGVLHRDVKPGNLLLDSFGKVWVADFGLARIEQDASMTVTGDLLGTLRYMAPEQASSNHGLVDHRADIYALGATLYELLTLSPLFSGGDREKLLHQILVASPPPPSRLNAGIPRELETIVEKAISKEVPDRYASATDLAEDLRRFLDDRPILAKPPSVTSRVYKWCLRNPRIVGSFAVASAAILIGASMWYAQRIRQLGTVRSRAATAKALAASEQYEAAYREASLASSHVNALSWDAPRGLKDEIQQLEEQLDQKRDAHSRFNRLKSAHEAIVAILYITLPSSSPSLQEDSRRALEIYDAIDTSALSENKAYLLLGDEQRNAVKRRLMELLFIQALCGIDAQHETEEAKQAAYRDAISLLDRVVAMHRDFPGVAKWQAEFWRALGENDIAVRREEQTLKLNTESGVEWFLLGEHAFFKQDYAKAQRCFERTVRDDPRNILAILSLAYCHQELAQRSVDGQNRGDGRRHWDVAEALCTGALASNPRITSAYLLRSSARMSKGGNDDALAKLDLDAAGRLSPNHFEVLIKQAKYAGQRGQNNKCIELLELARRLTPETFPEPRYLHAHWLVMAPTGGQMTPESCREAISLLTQTLALLPRWEWEHRPALFKHRQYDVPLHLLAHILRGITHLTDGDQVLAENDFRAAVDCKTESATAKTIQAIAHVLLGQVDEARTIVRSLDPNEIDHGALELLIAITNLGSKAFGLVEQITDILPNDLVRDSDANNVIAIAFDNRGRALMRAEKRHEAVPFFIKSAELAPLASTPRFDLGKCHFLMGDYETAVLWLTKAIDLDPQMYAAYGTRALALASVGKLNDAITDLDHILSQMQHSLWGHRAVYQLKLGRLTDYAAAIRSDFSDGFNNCPTWWFTLASVEWDGIDEVVQIAQERVNDSERIVGAVVTRDPLELRKELGTALYRMGLIEEAAKELGAALTPIDSEDALNLEERVLAASFLSMAEFKLGNPAIAKKWLNRAIGWAEQSESSNLNVLRIELALAEASKTLRVTTDDINLLDSSLQTQ